ncbi:hypothetical protein STSO111631_09570 [Stackebrandtia soli]
MRHSEHLPQEGRYRKVENRPKLPNMVNGVTVDSQSNSGAGRHGPNVRSGAAGGDVP